MILANHALLGPTKVRDVESIDGHYVMWYGYGQQPDLVAKDWNAIFNTIFFDGKTLQEILPDITDYEAP